jgi:hypothetical protein
MKIQAHRDGTYSITEMTATDLSVLRQAVSSGQGFYAALSDRKWSIDLGNYHTWAGAESRAHWGRVSVALGSLERCLTSPYKDDDGFHKLPKPGHSLRVRSAEGFIYPDNAGEAYTEM